MLHSTINISRNTDTERTMQQKHPNITCRVLGIHEMRSFEFYLKSRNMDSRSMYFGCAVSDESITNLVAHMLDNSSDHKVVVAEDENFEIVGTVHIAAIDEHEVELGIMVSEAYRGMGISTILMDYVLNWCRNRNYDSITMFCLSYNAPILHVVKKYGLEISKHMGNSEAKVILPRANIFTLGRENLANQRAIIKQNVMSFKRMLATV